MQAETQTQVAGTHQTNNHTGMCTVHLHQTWWQAGMNATAHQCDREPQSSLSILRSIKAARGHQISLLPSDFLESTPAKSATSARKPVQSNPPAARTMPTG